MGARTRRIELRRVHDDGIVFVIMGYQCLLSSGNWMLWI